MFYILINFVEGFIHYSTTFRVIIYIWLRLSTWQRIVLNHVVIIEQKWKKPTFFTKI